MSEKTNASIGQYVLVWVALIALLLTTLGSAYVELGFGNVIVNMGVSVAKTLLVMTVYMHLSRENAVLRLAAAVGFFWLALMFILTLSDYLTR